MFVRKLATALALVIATAGVASAQTPTRIQQFNAWGAYSYQANGGKVCYVLSVPKDKTPPASTTATSSSSSRSARARTSATSRRR